MVLDPDGKKARKILKNVAGSDFSFSLNCLLQSFVRCSCLPLPLFIARKANNTQEERKSGPATFFRIVDLVGWERWASGRGKNAEQKS